ncbi:tetratricopeptide repeat protein [Stenotrophomonas sp.]|uniref:O-linked N-acetylglucosamine transferase, SPINDLY family protein n=1 Tax=Stenotrophomonas sp. TaxID=69392 RepID=UPI0028AFB866|nr:tetratricopeptide repeat protein [Stenotrophomonas sp.]
MNRAIPQTALQPVISALSRGDAKLGETLARKMLRKHPTHAEALHLCGVACLLRGKADAAEQLFEQALGKRELPAYYLNLALARQKLGKDSAASAFEKCLQLQPDNAQAANNLGNMRFRQYRFAEAEQLYRQAIAHNPGYLLGYQSLGNLLCDRRRSEEAIEVLQQGLALAPDAIALHATMATALENRKRLTEAAHHLRRAGNNGDLQRVLRSLGDWRELETIDKHIIQTLGTAIDRPENPWGLINIPQLSAAQHRDAGLRFSMNKWQDALRVSVPSSTPVDATRLRVGYLSCDFYDHATLHLLMGVLESHDPDVIDVQLFDHSPRRDDAFTARLTALDCCHHDLSQLTDTAAAQLIAEQQLHLLIDLKGYTTGARLGITAQRPAPVVISWLGYPGSLGNPRLADYIIGDATVTPAEHADNYSEHIAQMPHCYQPNDRQRPLELSTRGHAGLPGSALVLCSFNQLLKLNPAEFDLWCRLLKQVPDSVLWLLDPGTEQARNNIRNEMSRRQVSCERLIFAPRCDQAAHIARLALADIALDSFPYTSHTTGSDALWAGVPLLARKGDTFASRVSASLLHAHGFDELIADNASEYYDKLLALAHNPGQRASIRQRLQQARLQSPLFDTLRFTRDLEALYAAIWEHHSSGKTASAPVVAKPRD